MDEDTQHLGVLSSARATPDGAHASPARNGLGLRRRLSEDLAERPVLELTAPLEEPARDVHSGQSREAWLAELEQLLQHARRSEFSAIVPEPLIAVPQLAAATRRHPPARRRPARAPKARGRTVLPALAGVTCGLALAGAIGAALWLLGPEEARSAFTRLAVLLERLPALTSR